MTYTLKQRAAARHEAWRIAKIRRGVQEHITNHSPGQENLLLLSFDEMPQADRDFDLEVEALAEEILSGRWPA